MVTSSDSRVTARPEIPALTGVRFLAAFCILLNHLLLGYVPRDVSFVSAFLSAVGGLGMTMFFVLSGFIVHYNYSHSILERRGLQNFFIARVARLYPLYIFVVMADLLFVFGFGSISISNVVKAFPFYLTATHSWFYLLFTVEPIDRSLSLILPRASLTWSISTEVLLYLAYPFLFRFLAPLLKFVENGRWRSFLFSITTVLLISYFYGFLKKQVGWFDGLGETVFGVQATRAVVGEQSFSWWALFISPYARVFEFFSGMIIAQAYLRTAGRDFRRLVAVLGGLSLLYIMASVFPEASWYPPIRRMNAHVGYLPFCVGFVAWMAWGGSLLSKILGSAPLRFLGDRSYSFYLLHIFVYIFGVRYFSTEWSVFAKIAVTWTVLFVLVCISYRYLEVPARRYIRNRFS